MATVVDHAENPSNVELVEGDEALYTCKRCGEQVPASRMTKSFKKGSLYVYRVCLKCSNARKREYERQAIRRADGTLVEPVRESDPWPAQLLVDLLRDDRDHWSFDFDTAWGENVAFVLARIPKLAERDLWREAFEGTRTAWQAAWSNVPATRPRYVPHSTEPAKIHHLSF